MQLVAKASIKLKDVTDLEVVVVLSKLGLSQADILGLVIGSALMLCLIFIFLFLGMGLFIEGAASDGQAVINSLITAGSALAFNANASAGGGTKLKELLNKAMEYVRKMQGVGEFSFDVNKDCAGDCTHTLSRTLALFLSLFPLPSLPLRLPLSPPLRTSSPSLPCWLAPSSNGKRNI